MQTPKDSFVIDMRTLASEYFVDMIFLSDTLTTTALCLRRNVFLHHLLGHEQGVIWVVAFRAKNHPI